MKTRRWQEAIEWVGVRLRVLPRNVRSQPNKERVSAPVLQRSQERTFRGHYDCVSPPLRDGLSITLPVPKLLKQGNPPQPGIQFRTRAMRAGQIQKRRSLARLHFPF